MAGKLNPDLLTVREASSILHVHTNTIRHWSNHGKLPVFHIGPRGDRRFKRKDVLDLLERVNRKRPE